MYSLLLWNYPLDLKYITPSISPEHIMQQQQQQEQQQQQKNET